MDETRTHDGTSAHGSPLSPGSRLGPYEIQRLIGAGGMGLVYQARDSRLGRMVAIKVLPPDVASNRDAIDRLEREARAISGLNHPNICALYDIGEQDGRRFLVMEYLEGDNLADRLRSDRLSLDEALRVAGQIARALHEAHQHGIVHRDLKPANVMLTKTGAKLLDFGVAKPLYDGGREAMADAPTAITAAGVIIGTPQYMAPEQLEGRAADPRTDVFALGLVLYEMLAGRKAFDAPSRAGLIAAILAAPPPPLPKEVASIPGLERIVHRCLEKRPDDRFGTMRDAAAALDAIVSGGAATVETLAVLPFTPAGPTSSTGDAEYLCEGIAETIINTLARLKKLRVSARTTVARFKGRDVDPEAAGRELGVGAILTGKVLQRGEMLRVQVELVNVADGSQVWGQRYDRRVADIFAIEEEIAREISDTLKLRLTGREQQELARRYTADAEAYQLYLRGRYYWNRRTGERLRKAIAYFRQAIDADPGYALPWAGLADCYGVCGFYSVVSPTEALPKGVDAAKRAIEIDGGLAEPYASLGWITMQQWDWGGAERYFLRAIELNPTYATAFVWFGVYLHGAGRFDEARVQFQRAMELEPLSLIINTLAGWSLCFERRYDQALTQLRKTVEIDSRFARVYWDLGIVHEQMGMYDEAIAAFQYGLTLSGDEGVWLGSLGHAFAAAGRIDAARLELSRLEALARRQYVPPLEIALVHAGLGDTERTFAWLEKACDDRSTWLCWIKSDPRFDGIRDDRRYPELLRRINVPATA